MKLFSYVILIHLILIKFCYVQPHQHCDNEGIKNKYIKSPFFTSKSYHNPFSLSVDGTDSLKNVYSFIERRPKKILRRVKRPATKEEPEPVKKDEDAPEETKPENKDEDSSIPPKRKVRRTPRLNINRKNGIIRNARPRRTRESRATRRTRTPRNRTREPRMSRRNRRRRRKIPPKTGEETPKENNPNPVEPSKTSETAEPVQPKPEEKETEEKAVEPEAKKSGIKFDPEQAKQAIGFASTIAKDFIAKRKNKSAAKQQQNPEEVKPVETKPEPDGDSELDKAVMEEDKSEKKEPAEKTDKSIGLDNEKRSDPIKKKDAIPEGDEDEYDKNDNDILGNNQDSGSTDDDEDDGEEEEDKPPESNPDLKKAKSKIVKTPPKKSAKRNTKIVEEDETADEDETDEDLDELVEPKKKLPSNKPSTRRDGSYSENCERKGGRITRHNNDIDNDYDNMDYEEQPKKKNYSHYEDDENDYEPPSKSHRGSTNGRKQQYEDDYESDEYDDEMDDQLEEYQDDVEDVDDLEEADEEDENEYIKRFKTPSGLEYLGAGYDLIKGNPLGDNITLLDPGYKSSVIQMHWNKSIENISNSLQFLQPIGGWIRPYSSCHKVETVTEISSSDSILKSLSADASVAFALPGDSVKFAASAKYKKLNDASKSGNSKMFINKSYCFKYVAGISTSLEWDFTLGFQATLDRLLENFKGLDHESLCKPYIYREDPNNENCDQMGITDWMELFNTFGTHVATKIYLGGKIFTTMEVKRNQEKKLTDKGMDVKALLSAQIKDTTIDSNVQVSVIKSNNTNENLLDTKKSTFVIGGDIYGHGKTMDFTEWSKSVSDHPMPIKAEFTPISHFMAPRLHEAYKNAYLYYGKVILESDFLRYQTQIELTAEEFINEIDIEYQSANGSITLKCKDGKLVQFGFVILTLRDNRHEVTQCPVHKSECSSPFNDDIVYSAIWIGCRSQNIINLKQMITKDKDASCDKDYNILLGSYFFDSKSNYLLMKPCKLGDTTCQTETEADYTWLVCTKKFWQLNSKSKIVKKSDLSSLICTPGETIAFGLTVEWIKNSDGTTFPRIYPCKKDEHECSHRCTERCNRIVQYIVCK